MSYINRCKTWEEYKELKSRAFTRKPKEDNRLALPEEANDIDRLGIIMQRLTNIEATLHDINEALNKPKKRLLF